MNFKILGALALLLTTALAHAELPKDVLLDKHLRAAASYFKNKQYQQCLGELDKAEQLADGKLASELIFVRAKSHFELKELAAAKKQATLYIEREGMQGGYYEQALELIISVEKQAAAHTAEMRKCGDYWVKDQTYQKKDYVRSFKCYIEAAELGDAFSQAQVGWHLRFGKGVPEDKRQAVAWFEKAVAQGNAYSMESLGDMYYTGEGPIAQDWQKAMAWYTQAAAKGRARALRVIGIMYAKGQGVKADTAQAYEWYVKAADKGDERAKGLRDELYATMASNYLKGNGVAKDEKKAVAMYVELADRQKSGEPLYNLANEFFSMQEYDKQLEWIQKSAERNYRLAVFVLANDYEAGTHRVAQDIERAFHDYERLTAIAGEYSADAYQGMGRIIMQENSIGPDWRKAEEYFNSAKDLGSEGANFYLALIKSTSPFSNQRDAQAADALLKNVAKIDDDYWFFHMTRAAVRAEQGQFEQAVALQEKAIATYRDIGGSFAYFARYLKEQLASYQQKQPWRYTVKGKFRPDSRDSGAFDPFNL